MADTVDTTTGEVNGPQPEFEGMPMRKPGIWPDVIVLGRAERVYTVMVSMGGAIELKDGDIEATWIAEQLALGAVLTFEVEATVTGVGHKTKNGQALGLAKVTSWDIAPAGEIGLVKLQRENRRVRETATAVMDAADNLSSALGKHFAGFAVDKVPPAIDEAHANFRLALAGLR